MPSRACSLRKNVLAELAHALKRLVRAERGTVYISSLVAAEGGRFAREQVGHDVVHHSIEVIARHAVGDESDVAPLLRREKRCPRSIALLGVGETHLGQAHDRDDGGHDAQPHFAEAERGGVDRDRDIQ